MALSDFDSLIHSAINQVGIPNGLTAGDFFSLITAVIQQESTFNPTKVSSTGDYGLMQINAATWLRNFGLTIEQLFDPLTNIITGATILRDYINSLGIQRGIAAYNTGPSGIFSTKAINYVNSVIGYWNNFKAQLRNTVSSGFYFVDPGLTVSDDVTWFSIDDPATLIDNGGYNWAWLALIALAVYFFADEIL